MKLTNYTDYGLRVLTYLALNTGRSVTVREIAESYSVSRFHLMKVVQQLVREGWVESLRGRQGGLQLAGVPKDIIIGDVVRKMEDGFCIVECFGTSSQCTILPACKLKGILGEALNAFLAVLDGYTLQDICSKPATLLALFPEREQMPVKKRKKSKRS